MFIIAIIINVNFKKRNKLLFVFIVGSRIRFNIVNQIQHKIVFGNCICTVVFFFTTCEWDSRKRTVAIGLRGVAGTVTADSAL